MCRVRTIFILCALLMVLSAVPAVPCFAAAGAPAARGDWWTPQLTRIATDGIGDYSDSWQNSYPWSMWMFKGTCTSAPAGWAAPRR